MNKREARQEANKTVNQYSAVAAGMGAIPFSACATIIPLQIKMCHDIAQCFQVTNYTAETVIGTLGASLVGHTIADTFLSFVPGIGTAIKVGTAGSVTLALGGALIDYFEERSPLY